MNAVEFGTGVIGVLLVVIGFFLSRLVVSVQRNTESIGQNKGNINLVKQQQELDITRIQETTQLEIRNMASSVEKLSVSVNTLVTALAKKGIETDE